VAWISGARKAFRALTTESKRPALRDWLRTWSFARDALPEHRFLHGDGNGRTHHRVIARADEAILLPPRVSLIDGRGCSLRCAPAGPPNVCSLRFAPLRARGDTYANLRRDAL
jgi:hypothetical protein